MIVQDTDGRQMLDFLSSAIKKRSERYYHPNSFPRGMVSFVANMRHFNRRQRKARLAVLPTAPVFSRTEGCLGPMSAYAPLWILFRKVPKMGNTAVSPNAQ